MVNYLVVVAGWIGGGVALGSWSSKECVSLEWNEPTKRVMVLFPLPTLIFGEGIMCPAFQAWSANQWGAVAFYRVLVVLFWPLKIAWSVCALLLVLAGVSFHRHVAR
jgi:hypothetical protein